mmetsp:Transcript_47098/g.97759  ORF Transcript_47098/g.97759 Transcript_47098/m.97759 type:complete len:113 (-) Transcript_47098:199-537(-)
MRSWWTTPRRKRRRCRSPWTRGEDGDEAAGVAADKKGTTALCYGGGSVFRPGGSCRVVVDGIRWKERETQKNRTHQNTTDPSSCLWQRGSITQQKEISSRPLRVGEPGACLF